MLTLLDSLDLAPLFSVLALAGALLCLYVMQKSWHDATSRIDPPSLRWLRRGAKTALALALCWAVIFFSETGVDPPVPLVGLVLALDLQLAARAATLFWRSSATHRREYPRLASSSPHFQNQRRIG